MNEIEVIRWQLKLYHTVLYQHIDRLYNALEELQRISIFLTDIDVPEDEKISKWLHAEGFAVDDNGFFQSLPLLSAFRKGKAPEYSVSLSWGHHLSDDKIIRREMYRYRNIGLYLKNIHDRLGDIGWIYYQSINNTSLQYPYIDQSTAITFDFDWTSYYTFLSVSPENNPDRKIQWTPPSIDYAGEGMILCVSIPVWREDVFIGLWSIDLPVKYLYRDFASVKTYPDQMQFIANSDGLLLLHDNFYAKVDQTRGKISMHHIAELGGEWEKLDLDKIINDTEGTIRIIDSYGKEWVYCFIYMPGLEWILFSGIPKLSMEESAARWLKQAFQQIADGNFSHRIESSESNALGILIDEFNKMSTRLDQAEKHKNEIEKQLRHSQKLEAIGRLAGGIAHDYNNITNVIMGFSELSLDEMKDTDPLYNNLQEIYQAAIRSEELTRQLLAFARHQNIDPHIVDINQAVSNILAMLHRLIGENIELFWYPGVNIWPILIDPTQLDQILANLCVNASDAISKNGKIIIETANVNLDETYCSYHKELIPGEFVMLSVNDNGTGMDEATREKIFEPFFSTKSTAKGTGLGLSTVYGIVKQNKGFINVYSEPGEGAIFKIYFPREYDQISEPMEKKTSEIPFGNYETLLVVDDEAGIVKLTEKLLSSLKYKVIAAKSPIEAVSIAKKSPEKIDVLLTDVIMPQLNGNELSLQIKNIFPDIKVLFMSAYTSNVITDRAVLDKDVFLIQKPFSKKEIAIRIRELLDN